MLLAHQPRPRDTLSRAHVTPCAHTHTLQQKRVDLYGGNLAGAAAGLVGGRKEHVPSGWHVPLSPEYGASHAGMQKHRGVFTSVHVSCARPCALQRSVHPCA
eukprot:3054643-Rhodomonas_salina.1